MMCYRDCSYCSDQDQCATSDTLCYRKLTVTEAQRAGSLGLPIAWMSFKDHCGMFTEVKK